MSEEQKSNRIKHTLQRVNISKQAYTKTSPNGFKNYPCRYFLHPPQKLQRK